MVSRMVLGLCLVTSMRAQSESRDNVIYNRLHARVSVETENLVQAVSIQDSGLEVEFARGRMRSSPLPDPRPYSRSPHLVPVDVVIIDDKAYFLNLFGQIFVVQLHKSLSHSSEPLVVQTLPSESQFEYAVHIATSDRPSGSSQLVRFFEAVEHLTVSTAFSGETENQTAELQGSWRQVDFYYLLFSDHRNEVIWLARKFLPSDLSPTVLDAQLHAETHLRPRQQEMADSLTEEPTLSRSLFERIEEEAELIEMPPNVGSDAMSEGLGRFLLIHSQTGFAAIVQEPTGPSELQRLHHYEMIAVLVPDARAGSFSYRDYVYDLTRTPNAVRVLSYSSSMIELEFASGIRRFFDSASGQILTDCELQLRRKMKGPTHRPQD